MRVFSRTCRAATFAFSANETSTFECALDSGGFKDCSSPTKVKKLKKGKHTFQVRATDANGNRSAATTFSWRVKK